MSETKISSSEQEQEKQMFKQWETEITQEIEILKAAYPQAKIKAKFSDESFNCMITFTYDKKDVTNTTGTACLVYENDTKQFVLFLNNTEGLQCAQNFGEAKNILIADLKKELESIFGKK